MSIFIKNYLLKIYNKLKLIYLFFNSLIESRKSREITIVFISGWMIGWDLENRLLCYAYLLNKKNILMIDLHNNFQVAIANYFISEAKLKIQLIPLRPILERCLWDIHIRESIIIGLENKEEYLNKFKLFSLNISEKKYIKIANLIKSKKIKNILLIQEAYLELWIANIAGEFEKPCYFPETEFGFVLSSSLKLCAKKKLYQDLPEKYFDKYLNDASNSLKSRVFGDYINSSLGQYNYTVSNSVGKQLDNFDFNRYRKVVVYFMHAFTDSPNYGLYDEEECIYFDHYDFILNLKNWASNNEDVLLLFRFHPHSDSYPADYLFNKAVHGLVDITRNMDILSNEICVGKIIDTVPAAKIVLLSGFGSVNLETAFLGIKSYNYKKNIYTEIGLSKYFTSFNDLITDSNDFDENELRVTAVKIEASREYFKKLSVFSINNSNLSSMQNFVQFFDELRQD